LILPLTLSTYFFKRLTIAHPFNKLLLAFYSIISIAVLISALQGQPFFFGLKAARGYCLLLFYFVFVSRRIDYQRLSTLIILTGILLMVLNNMQYLGSLQIFHYSQEVDLERGGRLRFLMGDFFTIFAPIIALGAYLQQKQKWHLAACLYMTATVFIQGQTRAVIFGMIATSFLLMYLSQRIRLKFFTGTLAIIIVFILTQPMLQKTFISNLFQETVGEIVNKSGNVGIRYDAYDYYWKETSPYFLTGRGIWDNAFTDNNPENMRHKNIYISDIGIMGFLFHTGLLGAVWLCILIFKVYHIHFESFGKLRGHINYGIVGYFIFSVTTLATLNGLVQKPTIIYLALALAIISQYDCFRTQNEIA